MKTGVATVTGIVLLEGKTLTGFLESKIPDKEGDTTSHNIMPDAEARFSAAVR